MCCLVAVLHQVQRRMSVMSLVAVLHQVQRRMSVMSLVAVLHQVQRRMSVMSWLFSFQHSLSMPETYLVIPKNASTVKCHLSGRHLSEHVGYPTVGSTKYFWLPDIQNLIVVPLIAHTRYLPVEYIYMDHTISSDLRCNETCMRQGSLLPTAQNM